METLSFQAPTDLKNRLEEVAEALDRSKAYVIRQALEEHLQDIEDYIKVKNYKASYDPRTNLSLAALKRKYKLK